MTVRDRLPPFVLEVVDDRRALRGLVAACLALGAAGLDPHVLDPGNPHMEALLRSTPSIRDVLTVFALVQAGLLLLGGAVADIWRSERLLRVALVGLAIASVGAVVLPSGAGLFA
ncbi:hypothetical protein I6F37_42670, partial [Bradyrhizobium sp. NBAIM08]|nr:hypothetical protein [Bradyrhizobium sp. NBAIM08]